MKIKKGQKLVIIHTRKGKFHAVAKESFDTKKADFFPVALLEKNVKGLTCEWFEGESTPCRASLVSSIQVEGEEEQG